MTATTAILPESTAGPWDKATYAFLAEKQRRSGSDRTVQGYSGMLRHFFGMAGKTPDLVTEQQDQTWGKAAESTTRISGTAPPKQRCTAGRRTEFASPGPALLARVWRMGRFTPMIPSAGYRGGPRRCSLAPRRFPEYALQPEMELV